MVVFVLVLLELVFERLDRLFVLFGVALQFFFVFAHTFTLLANLMTTPRPTYDCLKCPAYCCSYDRIIVENKDLRRLAKHFGIELETARRRFTKVMEGEQVLRHQKDKIYGSICMFLDTKTRRCTIYDARPGVCHEYPDKPRCGYYDFLKWERAHQEDEKFIPLKRG